MCALGEQIQQRHVDVWPQLFTPVGPNRDEPFWRSWLEKLDHIAFVAVRGDVTVGMIVASVATQTAPLVCALRVCHIASVVVAAQEQRKGVGRALVAAVEQWGQDNGAADTRLHVYAFNSDAVKLYEGLGYVVRSHTMGKLT